MQYPASCVITVNVRLPVPYSLLQVVNHANRVFCLAQEASKVSQELGFR